ncbi:recombinase family protein [Streptomyces pratens]|uniref:Recombinase family protein n=1 Tax=Streptomyces pratens TaxID=887456 RepID=A0ABW1M8J0_9ACTN
MNRPGTIRVYVRLSRTTDESTSVERQETEGRALAAQRWPGVPVVVYVDDGVSGALDPLKRPALSKLLDEWQRDDVVIVWKIDRLARSLFGFMDMVRAAEKAGTAIVSIHDAFDLSTPSGRMQASILATVAEWERENIRTRVNNARRYLHKVGRWTGGRVPYGLKPAPHPDGAGKILVRDDVAAKTIQNIVRRLIAGDAMTRIAADLQSDGVLSPRVHNSGKKTPVAAAWSSKAIRVIVESPTIIGHQVDPITKRIVRDGGLPVEVWEPIVSAEEQAQAIAALSPPTPRKPAAGRHWLYGVALCAVCGGNLKRSNGGKNQPDLVVLRCRGTLAEPHPNVSVRDEALSELMNRYVDLHLGGMPATERVYRPGNRTGADLERMRAYLTELEEDRKADMYTTDEARARFRRQYRETSERIAELESAPDEEPGWVDVGTGERHADQWERWNAEERGNWLRLMDVTVKISAPEVKRAVVKLDERAQVHFGSLEVVAEELYAHALEEVAP